MEKLVTLVPQGALTETSRISKPQLDQAETMRLDLLMAKTCAYYPHQEMSPETFAEFRDELKLITSERGIRAVEIAVYELRTEEFFPHPAKIRKAIDARLEREWKENEEERRRLREQQKRDREQSEHEKVHAEGGYCTMADIYQELQMRKANKKTEGESAAGGAR